MKLLPPFILGSLSPHVRSVFPSQVVFYEALKDLTDQGKKKFPRYGVNSSIEGLVLGGLAGGTLE